MLLRCIKAVIFLVSTGFAFFQFPVAHAQSNSRVASPSSLKEFQENGSSYFPAGTFIAPDGSPDDHFGDSIAWQLHGIGEPPLRTSDENSQVQAYRLIWIGFPAGRTIILRLQIEKDGTAKLYIKQTSFDGTTLLLNTEKKMAVAGVNKFLECVKRGDCWQQPTREQPGPKVNDGTYWFLEGVGQGTYHMVYRRTPELNPNRLTDIGRYLAKNLAQLEDSRIRIPRGLD
jgi:hypothetical protein